MPRYFGMHSGKLPKLKPVVFERNKLKELVFELHEMTDGFCNLEVFQMNDDEEFVLIEHITKENRAVCNLAEKYGCQPIDILRVLKSFYEVFDEFHDYRG